MLLNILSGFIYKIMASGIIYFVIGLPLALWSKISYCLCSSLCFGYSYILYKRWFIFILIFLHNLLLLFLC